MEGLVKKMTFLQVAEGFPQKIGAALRDLCSGGQFCGRDKALGVSNLLHRLDDRLGANTAEKTTGTSEPSVVEKVCKCSALKRSLGPNLQGADPAGQLHRGSPRPSEP